DVLDVMLESLTDPEALAEIARGYHAEYTEQQQRNRTDVASLRKKLSRVQVQIDRLVDAITDDSGAPVRQLNNKLKGLDIERHGLEEQLRVATLESNVVELHPKAIDLWKANITIVHAALERDAMALEHRAAFRTVIDSIKVMPTEPYADYHVIPFARLGALMGVNLFPTSRSTAEIMKEQGLTCCDAPEPVNTGS